MGKQNESTMKFKADISELKTAMQQAKTSVAQAKAEFEKSAEGLDNWRQSSEGVEAKLKQLRATLSAQNSILGNYREQLAKTEEQYGKNSIQAEQLRTKIEQQKSTISKTKSEINKFEETLRDVAEAESMAEREGISVSEALSKMKNSAKQAEDATDKLSDGYSVAKDVFAQFVKDALGAMIQGFKDLAVEVENANDKLQASIGATDEEMVAYKDQLQDLYNQGYGESIGELGDKFAYIKQVTGETDPSKIKDLVKSAVGLEDTFGSDFNETVRGVNNMMTHFGISAEEAFDLFAKGSQVGLDYTSELGDNVAEYGGNFAQAGYSAEEYFQLLENGSKGGAYNLDKVNDSINEIKNRIGDGTIKDNLSLFSSGTQNVFKEWQNGKASMKDVINSIVGDISNAKSEEEALTMAQVAFGTMGEDANLDVVKSLTTLGDTFDDVKGTMENVDTTRYDNLSTALEVLGRTLKDEILHPIVDTIAPVITDFVQWVIDHIDVIAPIVAGVAAAFGVLAGALMISNLISAVQKAFKLLNTTMLANPIVLIVALIAGLVVAFITLWNKSEAFRNFWKGLWEGIKSVAKATIDAVTKFFSGAWDTIKAVWSKVTGFFSGVWNGIKSIFSSVGSFFSGKFTDAVNKIKSVFSGITGFFSGVWEKIKSIFSNVGTAIGEAISGAVKGAVNSVLGGAVKLINKFIDALNVAIDIINAIPGVKISKVKHLSVPQLARGAVVDDATLAMIGENGKEAVVPLENNTGWIKSIVAGVLKELESGGSIGLRASEAQGGTTYNFYQTNNSPKELSRLDIYRQSKNLLSASVGVR